MPREAKPLSPAQFDVLRDMDTGMTLVERNGVGHNVPWRLTHRSFPGADVSAGVCHRLRAAGLIVVATERPRLTIYALSPAGRAALEDATQ